MLSLTESRRAQRLFFILDCREKLGFAEFMPEWVLNNNLRLIADGLGGFVGFWVIALLDEVMRWDDGSSPG